MARHADHQRVGTPLGHQLADRIERAGTGIDRAQRLGISGQELPLATPIRRVPKSKAR
jgi:hypothetical protein